MTLTGFKGCGGWSTEHEFGVWECMEGSLFIECVIRMTNSRKRGSTDLVYGISQGIWKVLSPIFLKLGGQMKRKLNLDTVVPDHLLWPVSIIHLSMGHCQTHYPLSSRCRQTSSAATSSLCFYPLGGGRRWHVLHRCRLWVLSKTSALRGHSALLTIHPLHSARLGCTASSCLCNLLLQWYSAHETWKHGNSVCDCREL